MPIETVILSRGRASLNRRAWGGSEGSWNSFSTVHTTEGTSVFTNRWPSSMVEAFRIGPYLSAAPYKYGVAR